MKICIKDVKEEQMLWKAVMSTHFNLNYNKTKAYEGVVISLASIYGWKKEKEIRSIVTNAVRAINSGALCLKIPRKKSTYTGNPQKISYERMMQLLDCMEKDGYVNLFIGGVTQWDDGQPSELETSITEMTNKFVDLLKTVNTSSVICKDDMQEIEIKSRGTKKIMNTQGVKGVSGMRQNVLDFNTALIESRISLKGIELPDQKYKRVFIENLRTGGRWYNSVGGVQTMDKTLRPFLQIDNQDLVELDFKAMHANILYEQLGEKLEEGFDPYAVDLWEMYVDPSFVQQFKVRHGITSFDPGRNLVKMAVMIGLNAKDQKSAIRALSQKIGQDRSKYGTKDEHRALYYGIKGEDFKQIFSAILEHNSLIADKFFKDSGVYLQFVDSEILDSVISDTLAINEVLLPYHDGLLVKSSVAEQVKGFMYKAWYKQLGSINFCKVEKK